MTESDLMRSIMIALSNDGHFVVRVNVGKFKMEDGRWFDTGLPKGFSDLTGMTSCGLFFVIEVKTSSGKISPEQAQFIRAMETRGGIAFVARSVDQALHELRDRARNSRLQRAKEWAREFVVPGLHEGGNP